MVDCKRAGRCGVVSTLEGSCSFLPSAQDFHQIPVNQVQARSPGSVGERRAGWNLNLLREDANEGWWDSSQRVNDAFWRGMIDSS
jgi:hypothetical protein